MEQDSSIGTRVYLIPKDKHAHYFQENILLDLLTMYGEMLPVPIYLEGSDTTHTINSDVLPEFGLPARATITS